MADRDKNDIKKRLEELRKDNNRKNKQGNENSPFSGFLFVLLVVLLSLFTFLFQRDIQSYFQEKKNVSYSEFLDRTRRGEFREIDEKDDKLVAKARVAGKDILFYTKKITDRVGNEPQIINAVESKNVKLNSMPPSGGGYFLAILLNALPLIIMIGLMVYLAKKMSGGGQGGPGNIFGFGKSRVNKIDKKPDVKFEDVAGVDGAKEELKEVVDFLKNPDKYTKAGARVPKGVLLLGRPGTGKTLLAKAVAGESGASFFSISGSEFVEMFVGVGASRVRDLFEKAKESSPSIIFIDEIELNLHPRNQLALIKLFNILTKYKIKFIMSTHSPLIMQEINNMILYEEKKKNSNIEKVNIEYNVNQNYGIDKDDINVWFLNDGTVNELKVDEEGVETSTFNKVVAKMNNFYQDLYFLDED